MDHGAAVRWIEGLDRMGMKFGLERMQALMSALGQPVAGIPAVHVVGTNGKSSVTRMTAAILAAHGVRTGAYLSPHITGWGERIALDGVDISPRAFAHAGSRVSDAVRGVPGGAITQFEALTAVALDALCTARAEVIVLEAGLGGRLDATNVVDADVVEVSVRQHGFESSGRYVHCAHRGLVVKCSNPTPRTRVLPHHAAHLR